jgi:uncharacterized protein YbbC (DUF1343 family)
MIEGEGWLEGLDRLELTVVPIEGWRRSMRWSEIKRRWAPTSPNIKTFKAALVYPGIGLAGEAKVNEGRGTPTPFSLFGAPWLNGPALVKRLNAVRLAGVRFEAHVYTPRSIPGVALNPRFEGRRLSGVRVEVTDPATFEPLETGMHVLAALFAEARAKGIAEPIANPAMLRALAGTRRLHRMLAEGRSADDIIAGWQREVRRFRAKRAAYLLYGE